MGKGKIATSSAKIVKKLKDIEQALWYIFIMQILHFGIKAEGVLVVESDIRSHKFFSPLAQTCALITVGIASIAIMGWVLDWWILAGISMEYIPMAPSTALVFILLGSAVFAYTRWPAHQITYETAFSLGGEDRGSNDSLPKYRDFSL